MKMFRTFCMSFALAAVACVVFAFSLVLDVFRAGYSICTKVVTYGLELAANQDSSKQKPTVYFVQAKAFVSRLVKRNRPLVTASWRLCPST